jgi:two-component system LytT family response regulator
VTPELRVVIADDERPARSFLAAQLRAHEDVRIVGEAGTGAEAVAIIEREKPDVALLDLQMPELDGLEVVRLLKRDALPLVIFVTAHDEYAVRAFELHAVDYLLKPVEPVRLREALNRVHERLDRADLRARQDRRLELAVADYDAARVRYLERIPVRKRDAIVLVPVQQIASAVAEAELLHLTTVRNERHTITYRLKDLEARLNPERFIRLGRGVLANVDCIQRVAPMPGGMHLVTLTNGQELHVSRIQSRALRERLLRL